MATPQGPSEHPQEAAQPIQAVVASIEAIMLRANNITKFPEFQVVGDPPAEVTPVRAYCLSRFKTNGTSNIPLRGDLKGVPLGPLKYQAIL